jgi:hypothetical protein
MLATTISDRVEFNSMFTISHSEPKEHKPWWLHALAIGIGVLAFLCSLRFGYGWGASIGAAALGLIFPTIFCYRKPGKRPHRFWQAVTLLTILQIPLVIAARPLVEQFRFIFLLAFGFGDCVLVAFVLNWMCSGE